MQCRVGLAAGLALAASALAEGDARPPPRHTQLAAYTRQFVRLYSAENPDLLAYKKGAAKRRGLMKYESLLRRVHARNAKPGHPSSSDLLEALVLMELATAHHSLTSLQNLQAARDVLEKCCAVLANAEGAAAHALLGHLYFMVPPDPLSFGDKPAALSHLREALAMDPDGAWPNFYYGAYLVDTGKSQDAQAYLEKAKIGRLPPDLLEIAPILHSDAERQLKKLPAQP